MEIGIATMLRAAWIAGIVPILIASLPSSSSRLRFFHQTILLFAKRGKILQSSSQKFTVPQRFFSHFYLVAVPWTTFLVAVTWFYAYTTTVRDRYRIWRSVLLLLLMEAQVLRRLFETIYVFKYSPGARMHVFGYLTGIFFYTAAPLSFCSNFALEMFIFVANKMAEFIVIGRNRTQGVEIDWRGLVDHLLKLGWYSWIGVAIFIWGWIHQRRCHAILGSLRKNTKQVNEYVIPDGDWFEHVSSPHYLAEIVIYAGILVVSGGTDLTIWLLFVFVVANLVFAAAETHRWYIRKFDNYSNARFAIVPFVY